MPDWLHDLDLDADDIKDAVILFCALTLLTVVLTLTCCYVRRRDEERRRKEQETEEAGNFFSFHEALPHSIPREPHPLASVFALSGNKGSYPGHPYTTTTPQCPPLYQATPTGSDQPVQGNTPVVLGAGQHTATPLYAPSYFQPPAAPAYENVASGLTSDDAKSSAPQTPPPPYYEK